MGFFLSLTDKILQQLTTVGRKMCVGHFNSVFISQSECFLCLFWLDKAIKQTVLSTGCAVCFNTNSGTCSMQTTWQHFILCWESQGHNVLYQHYNTFTFDFLQDKIFFIISTIGQNIQWQKKTHKCKKFKIILNNRQTTGQSTVTHDWLRDFPPNDTLT